MWCNVARLARGGQQQPSRLWMESTWAQWSELCCALPGDGALERLGLEAGF